MRMVRMTIGIVFVSTLASGCQSADPAWWPGGRNYGQGAYGPAPLFDQPPVVEYSYPSETIMEGVPAPTIVRSATD